MLLPHEQMGKQITPGLQKVKVHRTGVPRTGEELRRAGWALRIEVDQRVAIFGILNLSFPYWIHRMQAVVPVLAQLVGVSLAICDENISTHNTKYEEL